MDQMVNLTMQELQSYRNQGGGKKSGDKIRFYCPVHGGDNQRSLEFTPSTGRFKCFNCQVYGYIRQERNFGGNRNHNRHTCKKQSQTSIDTRRLTDTGAPEKRELLPPLQRFQAALPGSPGEAYLKARGISLVTAMQLGMGYAMYGVWLGRQWKPGRLVFPHTRPDGAIVNIYGRAVDTATPAPRGHKHDHLPGRKGVFNAAALNEEITYICEGPFDALSLIEAGYKSSCAIFGTAGLPLPWVQSRKAVFCFDRDDGGEKYKMLAYDLACLGIEVTRLGKDPYGGCKDLSEAWMKYGTFDVSR